MGYFTDQSKIDKRKYFFDCDAADLAVDYFEKSIRHVKGSRAGELIVLEQWQKDQIIRPAFGWKHKKSKLRKFTGAFVEIPKKNGKTFIGAGFGALFLDLDPEPGVVPMFSLAGNTKQASLSFNDLKGIILQSDRLKHRAQLFHSSIIVGQRSFQPMSRESKTQEGINPQFVLADELHIHPNSDQVENAEMSMASREQPFMLIITTAGDNIYSFGYERHEYAIKVATGQIKDESLLVCIHCADKDDDPFARETWIKANPNFGVSVYESKLEEQANKARHSPQKLNKFKRYHLNLWTHSRDGWLVDHVWQKNYWPMSDDDMDALDGCSCFAAMDLSSTKDITALTLLFPTDDNEFVAMWWFWLPQDKGTGALDENKVHNYLDWVEKGYIVETPGNVVDYDMVIEQILELSGKYDIQMLGYDKWNHEHIVPQLEDGGIDCFKFPQNIGHMNMPTKQTERLLLKRKINHLKNPVARWMASNAMVYSDANGNEKIVKDKKRPLQKVDGIITLIMTVGMVFNEEHAAGSSLESGVLSIIKTN